MEQYNVYPPLRLSDKVTHYYPEIWDTMKTYHYINGISPSMSWSKLCYIPIGGAMTCISYDEDTNAYSDDDRLAVIKLGGIVSALAPWRLNKRVFVLDEKTEKALCQDIEDMEMPTDVLLQLPCMCFYVDVKHMFHGSRKVSGFFVHLEDDPKNDERELRILLLLQDDIIPIPVHIDEPTVSMSLMHTVWEAKKNAAKPDAPEAFHRCISEEDNQRTLKTTIRCLRIISYICAQCDYIKQTEPKPEPPKLLSSEELEAEMKTWFDKHLAMEIYDRLVEEAKNRNNGGKPRRTYYPYPTPEARRAYLEHWLTKEFMKPAKHTLRMKWTPTMLDGKKNDKNDPVIFHIITNA